MLQQIVSLIVVLLFLDFVHTIGGVSLQEYIRSHIVNHVVLLDKTNSSSNVQRQPKHLRPSFLAGVASSQVWKVREYVTIDSSYNKKLHNLRRRKRAVINVDTSKRSTFKVGISDYRDRIRPSNGIRRVISTKPKIYNGFEHIFKIQNDINPYKSPKSATQGNRRNEEQRYFHPRPTSSDFASSKIGRTLRHGNIGIVHHDTTPSYRERHFIPAGVTSSGRYLPRNSPVQSKYPTNKDLLNAQRPINYAAYPDTVQPRSRSFFEPVAKRYQTFRADSHGLTKPNQYMPPGLPKAVIQKYHLDYNNTYLSQSPYYRNMLYEQKLYPQHHSDRFITQGDFVSRSFADSNAHINPGLPHDLYYQNELSPQHLQQTSFLANPIQNSHGTQYVDSSFASPRTNHLELVAVQPAVETIAGHFGSDLPIGGQLFPHSQIHQQPLLIREVLSPVGLSSNYVRVDTAPREATLNNRPTLKTTTTTTPTTTPTTTLPLPMLQALFLNRQCGQNETKILRQSSGLLGMIRCNCRICIDCEMRRPNSQSKTDIDCGSKLKSGLCCCCEAP